jgi:nucleotide-binding universal stress UspA family protein
MKREEATMSLHTILHPTDYSELSHTALRWAVEEAQVHAARLIILHTVDTLGPENTTFGEVASQKQPEAYRQRLWDELRREELPDPTIPVEYLLAENDPVEAIVRIAAERHCDLIVLGSHGRRGLHRLLGGSVAEQVMRRASCPVLVVKLPTNETPAAMPDATEMHPHVLSEPLPPKG